MSKNKFSPKEKMIIVKEYLASGTSYIKLGRKYKVDESSIRKWVDNYQAFGEGVFEINYANLNYSAEFKKKVVAAYLNGDGSYKDIAIRFKIHAASTVLQWVKQYNNHMELTDSRPKGVVNMVNDKGRKTTYEEREYSHRKGTGMPSSGTLRT
jgi:transposase-like protein